MTDTQSESDRRVARQVTQEAGSSFTCAFMFLSRTQREALEAVYAFTRHTDDLADDELYAHQRAERFAQWRALVTVALQGGNAPDAQLVSPKGEAILRRFADVSRVFEIPSDAAIGVLDGCGMDVAPRRYATFAELREYCFRVASCVGLLCLPVFGAPEAVDYAENLGLAFQLTNILRDVADDFKEGRVYFPQDEMALCGVTEDDLAAGRMTEGLRQLVRMQVDRAEQFYEAAEAIRPRERPRRSLSAQLMRHVYYRLLRRIRRPDHDLFGPRVRVCKCVKGYLLFRTWLMGR